MTNRESPGPGRPRLPGDPRRGGQPSRAAPTRSARRPMPGTASPTPQRQPAQGPHEAPTEPIAAAPRSAGARRRGGPSGNGAATVRRERQRRRRRGIRVLLVLALILLPFVLAVGWFAYQLRPGSDGPPVRFEIESGMGTSEVADALAEAGVIDSALAFKLWSTLTGAGPFEIGVYELHEGQGIRDAISALDKGPERQPDYKLLLPPGLTVQQIAERVGQIPGKSAERFLAAVNSGTIRSKYQPAGQSSLEGLLFPDTYFIGSDESEESIARRLVARFDEIADRVGLASAGSPYDAIVAASLIQTEAKLAEDAPLISAVIRNRLAEGMPLQIDSTLCYARAQTTGSGCPPPPTDADKQISSPYNTYQVAALPPTPISSVTEASLAAALAPADVPYKFYVIADENGKHAFATTLAEHERNVAEAREKGLL